MIYRLNIEFFMLVNQILLYSVSNNTNNILFKLGTNSFNAVWTTAAQGSPLSPMRKDLFSTVFHTDYSSVIAFPPERSKKFRKFLGNSRHRRKFCIRITREN